MSRILCAALGMLFCAQTLHAQAWQEYISQSNRFIVNFPGEPDVTDIMYTSELDTPIPARLYSVDNEAGKYSMTVVDYTQAPRIYEELCATIADYVCDGNEVQTEIRGAVAFAAWNYRKNTDGEITYDGYAQVDGVPGHQLQISVSERERLAVLHVEGRAPARIVDRDRDVAELCYAREAGRAGPVGR